MNVHAARYVDRCMKYLIVLLTFGCSSSAFVINEFDDGATSTEPEVSDPSIRIVPLLGIEDTGSDTGSLVTDSAVSVDTKPSASDTGAPDTAPPELFKSTPGYVACGTASSCTWAKGERCCLESSGYVCQPESAPACGYTKTFACDESADCSGSPCCIWPSGGSQCTCVDGAMQLCMTNAECKSGLCVPYGSWPGHGKCAT